jgi:hypothetical protein
MADSMSVSSYAGLAALAAQQPVGGPDGHR